MARKIQDHFIDYGCGFPVLLHHVPMVKIKGKWIPDINYNNLEKVVCSMLCHKQTKLTGHEVRFIRLYMGMTLEVFAKRFGVRHPSVIKWENFKDKPTNMNLGTEKDIRLCLMSHLFGKRQIGSLYNELISLSDLAAESQEHGTLNVDLDEIAI